MSKIPFTLEAWLKDKNQKVETRSGKNVRIICWDKIGVPIVALVGGADDIVTYNRDGTTGQQMQLPSDLFIVMPEEELTEFEQMVKDRLWRTLEYSETFRKDENKWTRELAAELLSLAREQFIKDGYVIEKKAFHDAVKNVSPEVMKEVSENIDKANKEEPTEFEKFMDKVVDDAIRETYSKDGFYDICRDALALAKKELLSEKMLIEQTYNPDISKAHELGREEGIMFGKAEALKNLPRWKKDKSFETEGTFMGIKGRGYFVVKDGYSISVAELIKKLPGFKEDEK